MYVIKRIAKIVGVLLLSIAGLLLLICLLVLLPPVQKKIVATATNYLEKKTKTNIDIGGVYLSFPLTVKLEDIFIAEPNGDTLLSSAEITANAAFSPLLKGSFQIGTISLQSVKLNLRRTENDSLFNFQFLVNAFADSTKEHDPADTLKKDLDLQIGKIELKDIHLVFDDRYSGMFAKADLGELAVNVSSMNINTLKFDISNLNVDQTNLIAIISKKKESTDKTESVLPNIIFKNLNIKNTYISFLDKVDTLSFIGKIDDLILDNAVADLTTNNFQLDLFSLQNSLLAINLPKGNAPEDLPAVRTNKTAQKIFASLKKAKLLNNNFSYNKGQAPENALTTFDPDHISLYNLNADLSNLFYNGDSTNIKVSGLSFNESNRFNLKMLSADLNMNPKGIMVKNLSTASARSVLKVNAKLSYNSLEDFKNNSGAALFDLQIKETKIASDDLLYFNTALLKQKTFKAPHQFITLTLNAKGKINDIDVKDFLLQTSAHTSLSFKGKIKNATNTKYLAYSIPDLTFYTTKSDLQSLFYASVFPSAIRIPSTVYLKTIANGNSQFANAKINLGTEFGGVSADAKINFANDTSYTAVIATSDFNIGKLLTSAGKAGKVNLNATVTGSGLSKEKLDATFQLIVKDAYFNQYTYHNVNAEGRIFDQAFSGTAAVNDTNLHFDFDGDISFKKNNESYKFNADLKGINLQALHFSTEDIRLSANASADLKGYDANSISGNAGLRKLIVIKNDQTYVLDSTVFASINENKNREISLKSAIVGLNFKGNISPADIKDALIATINTYYDTGIKSKQENAQQFSLDISIHNHPIISQVLLPELTDFSTATINLTFDSQAKILNLEAAIPRMTYANQTLNDFSMKVSTDNNKLSAAINLKEVSSSSFRLNTLSVTSELADNKGNWIIAIGEKDKRKLDIEGTLNHKADESHEFVINSPVILDESEWEIPVSNYVRILKSNGIDFNDLHLSRDEEEFAIQTSPGNKNKKTFAFRDFEIEHVSRLLERDTSLISGKLNGVLNITSNNTSSELDAEIELKQLKVYNTDIADLTLKADNRSAEGFNFELAMIGNGNDLLAKGNVGSEKNNGKLDITADLKKVNATMIEGLSLGALSQSSGNIRGKLHVTGTTKKPEINGNLQFVNFQTTPKATKTQFTLINEQLIISSDALTFNSFTIKDYQNHTLDINGSIALENFSPSKLDLNIKADKFRLFNTTSRDNKLYYGKLIIGGNINVNGTMQSPVANANVKLEKESAFAFIVPESKLSTDKGEGIVEFRDTIDIDPILRNAKKEDNSGFKGLELTSRIEIDPAATLKIEVDPTTGDSLVVRGSANLAFSIDQSGKMSLTGLYELADGSYVATLEALVHKKFKITPGSTIRWNGEPTDADISIDALYTVTTSPIDLVSSQVAGLSDQEKNQYKQRLDFYVYLQLRGQILKPEISFRIELADKDKGALQGAVENRLNQLNEDESELNKQVFALLLLNRFVQEDPLASDGGGGASTFARTSVSKFLTNQLNQLAGRRIAGAELNFNVESFEDYSSGEAEGRTQVGVALKKDFFDDRFSVQVGGNVDVEGEAAQKNNMSDITGDVLIEYKITEDGRLRFSAFRRSEYGDIIEGQITETGVGFLYNRDFDRWKQFFRSTKRDPAL